MVPESIHALIRSTPSERPQSALEDSTALFWVEWREDDDQIPALCAAVLKTTELSSEWDDDRLYIVWRGRRVPVPLAHSVLDSVAASSPVAVLDSFLPVSLVDLFSWPSRGTRHTTMLALNQALNPEYEIRYLRGSLAEGGAAFAPLAQGDWVALEQQYGRDVLEAAFAALRDKPNLFTSEGSALDELSPPWWQFW